MRESIAKLSTPTAYWDRTLKVVRHWTTNEILPTYEGPCMVYLDTRGPVFVETFLREGERCWLSGDILPHEIDALSKSSLEA
jgi:hypothetical protein